MKQGFTLIELLVVIAIIAILASLVLAAAGSVQKKGARSRAEAEIAAIAAALESYKSDNGDYPSAGTFSVTNTNSTTGVKTTNTFPVSNSVILVQTLMPSTGKIYFEFKKKLIETNGYIDPFNNNYFYIYTNGSPSNGVNNYDLWSTAGDLNGTNPNTWIKNW
jgi:prepilin-type N-terminal cleavage/methylation domain-containing protein